mgnify:CR=1 FL=1
MLARRLVVRVVRPGGDEQVRIAILAGHRRGRGVRADVDQLVLERDRHRGEHDVREDDAGEEVHLVDLDVLLRDLAADVGLELIVADQHLGGQAAELAAVGLHGEQERVADVDADRGARPGKRADESDLDLVGALRVDSENEQRGRKQFDFHWESLLAIDSTISICPSVPEFPTENLWERIPTRLR